MLIFIVSFGIFGQDNVSWYIGKPIEDIQFQGLKNVPIEKLEIVMRNYIGKDFSDSLFLELQSKLYSIDYFDEFSVSAKSKDGSFERVTLVFDVIERPIIDKIKIEGNKNVRKADITEDFVTVIGEPYKRSKARMDKNSVRRVYKEQGFPDVDVDVTVAKDKSTNKATVIFKINEGNKLVISQVLFNGNSYFSDFNLKSKMKTKAKTLVEKGIFDESNLDIDKSMILEKYKKDGYLDIEITDIKKSIAFNPEEERNEITIEFNINEGHQYVMGDFDVYGNKLYQDEDITKFLTIEKGEILNNFKLEQSFNAIRSLYHNDGFIFNTIDFKPKKDPDNLVIDYDLDIVERMRAHIEKITIEGNEKTEEEVIIRELPFQEGDVFSFYKIQYGLRNLYALGYFDDIVPEPKPGSSDGLMELVIKVKEKQNTDIRFGLNFSGSVDESPVQLFLQWKDPNFLGKGYTFGAGTELSSSTQSVNVNFTENWLAGERVYLGGYVGLNHSNRSKIAQDILSPNDTGVPDPYEGYYVFSKDTSYNGKNYSAGDKFPIVPTNELVDEYSLLTDYEYSKSIGESINEKFFMKYETLDFNFGVSTGYTWSTFLGRLSIGTGPGFTLQYINYDSSVYRPYSQYLREHLRKPYFVNRWTTTFTWNYLDNPTLPQNGFLFKQSLTYAGGLMLGETHYNKLSTSLDGYVRLFNINVKDVWAYKTILRLHTSFDIILPQQLYDFSSKKWRRSNEADVTSNNLLFSDGMNIMRGWSIETGLYAIWQNMIELQMPIYEKYVWSDLFFEATGIWRSYDQLSNSNGNKDYLEDNFYFTLGGGLRLTVPGLPIGFYLAKRFKIVDGVTQWQQSRKGLDFVLVFKYSY